MAKVAITLSMAVALEKYEKLLKMRISFLYTPSITASFIVSCRRSISPFIRRVDIIRTSSKRRSSTWRYKAAFKKSEKNHLISTAP